MAGITLHLRSLRGQKNLMAGAVSRGRAFLGSVDTDPEEVIPIA